MNVGRVDDNLRGARHKSVKVNQGDEKHRFRHVAIAQQSIDEEVEGDVGDGAVEESALSCERGAVEMLIVLGSNGGKHGEWCCAQNIGEVDGGGGGRGGDNPLIALRSAGRKNGPDNQHEGRKRGHKRFHVGGFGGEDGLRGFESAKRVCGTTHHGGVEGVLSSGRLCSGFNAG